MAWNEAHLHRWLSRQLVPLGLSVGSGNDAAVLAARPGRAVACCDQTLAGVHFEPGTAAARVGRKAAGRALSDLAASAARPRALLLGGAFAPEVEAAWIRAALRAVRDAGRLYGAELIGGDLACSPPGAPSVLTVTALGWLAPGDRAVARDRARAGQVVVLTGAVGGSLLGRHLAIEPRVAAGRWLAAHGAAAMMDVSDGLALDLSRMAQASSVRMRIERVPVHADARRLSRRTGRPALEHALMDGEDHELIATFPAAAWARLEGRARRHAAPGNLAVTAIGRVEAGTGVYLPTDEAGSRAARWNGAGGWIHGA